MEERRFDANGLAILTGVSGLFCIDIDISTKDEKSKRPGIELWEQLVHEHGEPETLRARTGSGGIHLYFKADSPGLKRKRNFQGVKVNGEAYGIDGRAAGGVIFAEPTSYVNGQGELAIYRWETENGPPSYEACREMPVWLTELANNPNGHGHAAAGEEEEETEPVDPDDDMQAITKYTRGSQEVQDLLLRIVIEHAAPKAFANLGRLFAYLYMIECRILATTNETEKSRDQIFFVWNGTSWAQDTSNLVMDVFTSQMGCLLAWYEKQRERCLSTLCAGRPELEGFVVGGVLQSLDSKEVDSKQAKKVKMAVDSCIKELEKTMPSFGKINVQDPADVRKCMHSVVPKLHVKGLLDLFDQDPTVANAQNGLIDLITGALLSHHPQDLCNNQTCKYISGASTRSTARFQTFLMDILPPEAIKWLQMFLGYCLTGETSEELLVIANGLSGANGKSALKGALERAFGSYACPGNKAIFMKPSFKANGSAASSHLMQIRTNRFVSCDESDGVEELHASFLKEASTGGRINARELFCKAQSYVPQYKLFLFTNYRPHFPSDDTALIRRMVLMMFNYTFKTPDKLDANNEWHKPIDVSLKPYFESDEGAADTLDFCVRGAIMYYAEKELAPSSKVLSPIPKAFMAAVDEYAEENDKLQAFIDEACTTKGANLSVAKSDFVEAFTTFLYAGGHDVTLAGDGLARAMCLKGFSQKPPGGGNNPMIRTLDGKKRGRGFFGIRLKTDEELMEAAKKDPDPKQPDTT
ncbi:hypothetical protein KFL_008280020 [Klebsormidium nitens]|uniref:SF3 helicase domain-containing protein n=1 Tax=Klebsormidium nitens TaxID=105231 RepID=A0A1Y1IQZ2_KLENI|nr:hypothetical protein KFL_008280020 [Klebsormidium nitens]|eukprot:GAQ91661.1 hypothetical protein KFL_008280020 [Klebsormidium nitens]